MNTVSNSNNNEKALEVRTHDIPIADAMSEFMKQGWRHHHFLELVHTRQFLIQNSDVKNYLKNIQELD